MSKYQTLDTLKGKKTLDVNKYFKERRTKLEETKKYWGNGQTAVDEKFFNEKHYSLNEQQNLFRSFAESLGFEGNDFNDLDIHISFSTKENEND